MDAKTTLIQISRIRICQSNGVVCMKSMSDPHAAFRAYRWLWQEAIILCASYVHFKQHLKQFSYVDPDYRGPDQSFV